MTLGAITMLEENNSLCRLLIGEFSQPNVEFRKTPLLSTAFDLLDAYLRGEKQTFSELSLSPKGTPFQQKVWGVLRSIPYGATRSYAEVAAQIGCSKGCRAVGMANHANPLPIIIPCHRVIEKNGGLGGYAFGLDYKRKLLSIEGVLS